MSLASKFKKLNLLFFIKTGIGSAIAILLANSLGFLYSPSAGIITLLTIQNTKKETIQIALKRIIAFFVAASIGYLLFEGIGYTPISFGLFVFFFVGSCFLFQLKDGIAMNSVLMTHFLIEKRFDSSLVLNELGLLAIGMSLGIGFNLIMPRNKERIRKEQILLEEQIKEALRGLSRMLKSKDACLIQENYEVAPPHDVVLKEEGEVDFNALENNLDQLLKSAYEEVGNTLLSDSRYLVSYLEMRKHQLGVLKDIKSNILSIPVILRQSFPLSEFIDHIATSFHERNNVVGLLRELENLKEHFKNEKLPQSRDEFEYRATLFQILKELEYFLIIKRNFVVELEEQRMNSYWKE